MGKYRTFIIDKDILFAKKVEFHFLKENDINCRLYSFENANDALVKLDKNPDLVIIDNSITDVAINDFIAKIKEHNKDASIVVTSEKEDINLALKLLKNGIDQFIVKDKQALEHLNTVFLKVKQSINLRFELNELKKEVRNKYKFDRIIAQSSSMKNILAILSKIVDSKINVSLHGEVGTGKEVLAKTIHYSSIRKNQAFVSVNLAGISEHNFEKTLFGYYSNNSETQQAGIFERANRGTLYLSGFEKLNKQKQILLQKTLETKEVTRIGETTSYHFDVRIIMSYDHGLEEMISKKMVDESTYYSFMGVSVDVPPLRERVEDIILLVHEFINDFTSENNLQEIKVSHEAKEILLEYNYPGNLHELKSIIEIAASLCENYTIEAKDIKFYSVNNLNQLFVEEKTLKEYNRIIIKHFLNKYDNNILLVAEKLDVGKSTIYRMIKNGEI